VDRRGLISRLTWAVRLGILKKPRVHWGLVGADKIVSLLDADMLRSLESQLKGALSVGHACSKGRVDHLEACRQRGWLRPLQSYDCIFGLPERLKAAAKGGHVHVAQWLLDKIVGEAAGEDAYALTEDVFRCGCKRGCTTAAKHGW
jgi:hypothetical protein